MADQIEPGSELTSNSLEKKVNCPIFSSCKFKQNDYCSDKMIEEVCKNEGYIKNSHLIGSKCPALYVYLTTDDGK